MAPSAVNIVLAQADAYRRQDLEAADRLLDETLTFTSPQDDGIDKAAFLERCFPTSDHFTRQETRRAVELEPGVVLLEYVSERKDGLVFSNVEVTRVRDGRIVEIRVYFGGPDVFTS